MEGTSEPTCFFFPFPVRICCELEPRCSRCYDSLIDNSGWHKGMGISPRPDYHCGSSSGPESKLTLGHWMTSFCSLVDIQYSLSSHPFSETSPNQAPTHMCFLPNHSGLRVCLSSCEAQARQRLVTADRGLLPEIATKACSVTLTESYSDSRARFVFFPDSERHHAVVETIPTSSLLKRHEM
ncbi:hypothetical protein BT67DRAFT_13369 [Trichocladium antarcticum]|uniref:Uncharacterized protein n=1 Tax=Trichocladium antarcticum TaxID=1450529 RepID=A0AAN6USS5_9PEZI|nr:hypothetical protein BT67DRAFT_13369 [Trichocladium antarcticum]